MQVTRSQIVLRDVRLYAYHGVLPQERTVGGYYRLDISVDTDMSQAMATDVAVCAGELPEVLAGSISYAAVYDTVCAEMAVPSSLLEHVAGRICRAILDRFAEARQVELELLKENPPMGSECRGAGVKVTVLREGE